MQRKQDRARGVHRRNQPAVALHQRLALRKGEREVQEQRRLQQPRDDVRPVNDPVEVVQLAGVVERVEDERDQAENVEVRALGRGPAAQQDVKADAEIHQRDQPQPGIERAVRRRQNQWSFQRDALPHNRVGRLRPDADAIKLLLKATDVVYLVIVNRNQHVPGLDAGLLAGPVGVDALGLQLAVLLYPPDAIVWGDILAVLLEIDTGENDGGYA